MENHQNSPFDRPSQVFRGIRFVLIGFDPINKAQVSRKLVDGGGIDAGQYGPNCTHVIVNKIVYDDPVCVAAKRDGKILVSGLWADHSLDVGVPVDPNSVMYRPVRDLDGIPGAKSLVICLTGYQREDREDIMTMVDLMGAQFSKPLIANKVTHLICYKFEGEKYLLAKKMKRITLINHRWLEDCLKSWEIVSEANYSRSGYELEMEAEAKDSEDEAGGFTVRLNEVKKENPLPCVMLKQDVSTSVPNTSATKGFESADDMVSVTRKNTSDQFLNLHKGVTCEPSNLFEGTSVAKKSPLSESRKVIPPIYSRKVTMETTPVTTDTVSNVNSGKRVDKVNLSDAFNFSSSPLVEKEKEEQNGSSFGKRKMDVSCGSSKLQKTSQNEEDPFIDIPYFNDRPSFSPLQNRSSNSIENKLLNNKGKSVTCDETNSKVSTPKVSQEKEIDAGVKETAKFDRSRDVGMVQVQPHVVENVMHSVEKSSSLSIVEKSSTSNMEMKEQSGGGSSSKSVRRKSIAKKFSAPKQKTVNQKGSLHLENSEATVGDDTNLFKLKEDQVAKSAAGIENMSGNKSLGLDDETEPPEDKEEKHEDGGEPGPDIIDAVIEEIVHVISKTSREKKLAKKKMVKDVSGKKPEVMEEEATPVRASKRMKKKSKNDDNVTEFQGGKTGGDTENVMKKKKTTKKDVADSVKNVSDKKAAKNREIPCDDNIREEASLVRASKRIKNTANDLEEDVNSASEKNDKKGSKPNKKDVSDNKGGKKSSNKKNANNLTEEEGVSNDPEEHVYSASSENVVMKKKNKTKKDDVKDPKLANNKKGKSTTSSKGGVKACDSEAQKENDKSASNKQTSDITTPKSKVVNSEPMWFILTGHKLQRREYQQIIRRLKGKVCRVSHQWAYQATHFIVPDPIKRVEKFFAAAASGCWILKTDYLSASNEAGRFVEEEPYEWHKNGLSEDGQINLEAPRKWRLLKEKTGHGAFHGMRIVIYGECIAPTLDTLKRAVKAGDGTILATSPPYTRFLNTGIDYAIVSPGMPHVDIWVQEFIKHEIPCISADYLVEYVCKPGYPLERHVQFDTNVWAERSYNNLKNRLDEEELTDPATPQNDDVACEVCGLRDRGEEMMICGSENGSSGCGVGMHIDCCDPPFENVPEEDWFCGNCSKPKIAVSNSKKSSKRKGK